MKSSTCVTLNGGTGDTVYNNAEQTSAAPRVSNRFENVRVAAINNCGTGAFIFAEKQANPVVPYVCPDTGASDPDGRADSVTLTVDSHIIVREEHGEKKRTATGTVAWAYAAPDGGARELVCMVQIRGEIGITQQRGLWIAPVFTARHATQCCADAPE